MSVSFFNTEFYETAELTAQSAKSGGLIFGEGWRSVVFLKLIDDYVLNFGIRSVRV